MVIPLPVHTASHHMAVHTWSPLSVIVVICQADALRASSSRELPIVRLRVQRVDVALTKCNFGVFLLEWGMVRIDEPTETLFISTSISSAKPSKGSQRGTSYLKRSGIYTVRTMTTRAAGWCGSVCRPNARGLVIPLYVCLWHIWGPFHT